MVSVIEKNPRESGYKERKYGLMESEKFKKDERYKKAEERFKRPVTKY